MSARRLGIWFLGARGGVATTTILGLLGLRRGATETIGLVSALPAFAGLNLVRWDEITIGGHEIRETSLLEEARKLEQVSRAIDGRLVDACAEDLAEVDANIRPGVLFRVGPTIAGLAAPALQSRRETPRAAISRVQADLQEFAREHQLDQVIVVNVASTEPPIDPATIPARWADLAPLLEEAEQCPLPASSLYAVASLELGFPYINCTPSLGSAPPALDELARAHDTCHMGHDGKTGETLLKSVLAPMFAHRNLQVMSWVGHNIFGNMDGLVLNDPSKKQTKIKSKDRLLAEILGYQAQTHVSIEYIKSLGDWKTAWDHIHFRGFLGTPMILQFIWQGCDSLLAAPLVIDLVRFADRAQRRGDRGLLTFLASFFKSPLGTREHDFSRQFQMLEAWAAETAVPATSELPA